MIHRQIGQFDWKGVHNEDYFLHETIRKIRDLDKSEEGLKRYISGLTGKISSQEIKDKIITLCKHLSEADGSVSESEKKVIGIIESVLG